MKSTWYLFSCIGVIALLALAVACANTKNTENLLTLAGFRPVIAKTAKQQQQVKSLAPDKVTRIQRHGKTYYVFPDADHDRLFVGSPKEYRNYLQIRSDYQLTNSELADDKMDQGGSSDWEDWDGWEVVVWSD